MGQLEIREAELQIFHLKAAINECWSLIRALCRENDRLKYSKNITEHQEDEMPFILKGVYKRKVIEHPDAEQQAVRHLANTHPYSNRWDDKHAADYVRLYGQAEFDVLVASVVSSQYNMVEAYDQRWVVGGTFVPEDPLPVEVLGPDEEWRETPGFGRYKVKKSTGAIVQQPAGAGLNAQQLEALIDRVVMGCLGRAGLVKN
jgi:hypothetical protein